MTGESSAAPAGPTSGGLVHDLSQQIPGLIRSEMRLAQAEVSVEGLKEDVATIKGAHS